MWNWTAVNGTALALAICLVVWEHWHLRRVKRIPVRPALSCSDCVFAAMCSEIGCYCRVHRRVVARGHATSCPEYLRLSDAA